MVYFTHLLDKNSHKSLFLFFLPFPLPLQPQLSGTLPSPTSFESQGQATWKMLWDTSCVRRMKRCFETKTTEQYAVGPQKANNVMVVRKQKKWKSPLCVCIEVQAPARLQRSGEEMMVLCILFRFLYCFFLSMEA